MEKKKRKKEGMKEGKKKRRSGFGKKCDEIQALSLLGWFVFVCFPKVKGIVACVWMWRKRERGYCYIYMGLSCSVFSISGFENLIDHLWS